MLSLRIFGYILVRHVSGRKISVQTDRSHSPGVPLPGLGACCDRSCGTRSGAGLEGAAEPPPPPNAGKSSSTIGACHSLAPEYQDAHIKIGPTKTNSAELQENLSNESAQFSMFWPDKAFPCTGD